MQMADPGLFQSDKTTSEGPQTEGFGRPLDRASRSESFPLESDFVEQEAREDLKNLREDSTKPDVDFGVEETLQKMRWQRFLGPLVLLPFGYLFVAGMKFWGGYKIKNVQGIRRQFREMIQDPSPLIICGNHLTYIDSAIIIWALCPIWKYVFRYKTLSWNLPAGDHFKKKWIHRTCAFLFKCIFIHRDGSKKHKLAILNTARYLVTQGHYLTLFPEGRRSRSGRFATDKLSYGVGKLVYTLDNPRVLCVYLRSDKQENYLSYPPKGSEFYMKMAVIRPRSNQTGRKAYADHTHQIVEKIKEFENEYFAGKNS